MTTETAPPNDDGSLVRLAQCGRLDAYDALVARYRRAVLAIASRHASSRECAEDAVQETFLKAFRHLRMLREPARLAPWLYAIARQVTVDGGRRDSADRSRLQSAIDQAVLDSSEAIRGVEDDAIRRMEAESLISRLRELPEELATPIALQCEEDWSLARIAEFVGVPVSTIKWRMHEGRKRLRTLHEEGTNP